MTIATRFQIGDEVWVMRDNKPRHFCIRKIETITESLQRVGGEHTRVIYVEEINTAPRNNPRLIKYIESECYTSKEELITNLFG